VKELKLVLLLLLLRRQLLSHVLLHR